VEEFLKGENNEDRRKRKLNTSIDRKIYKGVFNFIELKYNNYKYALNIKNIFLHLKIFLHCKHITNYYDLFLVNLNLDQAKKLFNFSTTLPA